MRLPDFAFSPLSAAWVVVLLLAIFRKRLPKGFRWAGVAFEVLMLLLIAPVGANVLVGMVESRVPPASTCKAPLPTTIVLLSGGTDRRPESGDDFAALNATSLRRLFSAIALWHRTPGARLVISGGGWRVPEADLLAGLAERMGVPATAIELEGKSHTTWENARNIALLSPRVPERIWLVSSALHLPRALGAFRAWGFEPCAWPSGSLHVPFSLRPGYFVPQSSSLAKANAAIHELVGGAVYAGLEWKLHRNKHDTESGYPATASTVAGKVTAGSTSAGAAPDAPPSG